MSPSKSVERAVRVGLISLGCAKNLVDAEIMLGALLEDGVEITNDPVHADVLIVNTCSFIDSAQQESVDAILESAALRDVRKQGQSLIVAGCLPQRFGAELRKALPEVDAFIGVDQVAHISRIVKEALARRRQRLAGQGGLETVQETGRKLAAGGSRLRKPGPRPAALPAEPLRHSRARRALPNLPAEPLIEVHARPSYIPDYATPRFRLTPRHYAYLKIAEGCNHPCSFCIIPRMRGSHRSRPQADILEEARRLVAAGVKELNLISQDSTYYGLDLRPGHSRAISSPERFRAAAQSLPVETPTLCTLLHALDALPGDFWIRLLYTHPAHWTEELIRTLAACPKVARYVDLPLQHIHDGMLERMRRETSRQHIVDLIGRLRASLPGIALRTTFIVGFPGETEAHFQTLLDFIHEAKFERLGVFTYSQEEGTVAGKMSAQIPVKVRQDRRDRAMAAQLEVARRVSSSFMGRELRVLVEHEAGPVDLSGASVRSWEHGLIHGPDKRLGGLTGAWMVARGEADAPDIDGRVYVRGRHAAGEFARVRIVGHTDYDLVAEAM